MVTNERNGNVQTADSHKDGCFSATSSHHVNMEPTEEKQKSSGAYVIYCSQPAVGVLRFWLHSSLQPFAVFAFLLVLCGVFVVVLSSQMGGKMHRNMLQSRTGESAFGKPVQWAFRTFLQLQRLKITVP